MLDIVVVLGWSDGVGELCVDSVDLGDCTVSRTSIKATQDSVILSC